MNYKVKEYTNSKCFYDISEKMSSLEDDIDE